MVAFDGTGASIKLQRLQAAQQDLAARLVGYCRERGLQTFLVAGSALGAWRDSSMIAWDDDIDFGMLRDDYDRLITALIDEPIPGVSLQCWQTARGYPFAFAKLRLDGTRVDENVSLGQEFHQGIFIDIFPFDPLPHRAIWRKLQYALLLTSNVFVLSFSKEAAAGATRPLFRRLRLMALAVRPLVPIGALVAMREWALRLPLATKSEQHVSFHMYGLRAAWRTAIDRGVLVPPAEASFGNHVMPVPADCETYLTGIFGDFRRLPPPEKRHPAHIRDVDFG